MAKEVQAFWPGLEPDPVSALYQQVITNQGGGPGEVSHSNLGSPVESKLICCSGICCHFGAARKYPREYGSNFADMVFSYRPAKNLRTPQRSKTTSEFERELYQLTFIVYPGDTITTLFRWNPMTQNWFDNWLLQPGVQGNAAGETPLGGGLITDGHFDTAYCMFCHKPD